ncbi:MAG: amidohydrolase family protein, partial [Candidatus Bipolaricaulia bacterium]
EMMTAFGALAEWDAVALVHAEDEGLISSLAERLTPEQLGRMRTLAEARPDLCERSAIVSVARIASSTGCRTHIVHVSSLQGLEAVREGRTAGALLTAETCPQYLLLTRDVYDRDDGHLFSASPALRSDGDRAALWGGLRHRDIDFVTTDHCPFTSKQKAWRGDFRDLPYGLPGVETLLPLVYSEGVGCGILSLNDIPRLLSEGPARTFGLHPRKGAIEAGADADLVVFDPGKTWRVSASDLHMNVDFSPYEGREVTGRVDVTISRGTVLFRDGELSAESGRGAYIGRSA